LAVWNLQAVDEKREFKLYEKQWESKWHYNKVNLKRYFDKHFTCLQTLFWSAQHLRSQGAIHQV